MKKSTIITLVVIAVVVLGCYSWVKGGYNTMTVSRENVSSQWSNVENQYQRRADLIPNLVNVVKGYAAHESETLTQVVEARAKATQVQVNFDNVNEQTLARYSQAQGELSSALSRLMAISEAYPDLKANENFRDLQVQLEGTENRIAVERRNFNEAVRVYNTSIKMFPRNMLASMFGFDQESYFEANEGSEVAPTVSFE
ncbi:MAG: LemA family protein [Rikenellaceae bacterium]